MAEFVPIDPALRSEQLVEAMNEAFDSVRGGEASNSEPGSPVAGQFWADTDTGFLKQRNQDNDAWITLWSIDSAPLAIVPRVITATGSGDEYTIDPAHESFVLVDTTLGPVEVALPDCTVAFNKRISITKISTDTNPVTIVPFSGLQPITVYITTDLMLRTFGEHAVLWNTPEYGDGWFVEVDGTRPVSSHTLTGNIEPWEELVLIDTTAGVVTLTLPNPGTYDRRELIAKRTAGGNNAVVTPGGSYEIDDLGAGVGVTLASINDRLRLRSDGAQWWRVD